MPVRFGIIGFHHMHVGAMIEGARGLPGVELVAIADHDPAVLQERANQLGVPGYGDYREMLRRERLDAVGIAEVYSRRATIAADCLRAGVAVTADKPLCLSRPELERLAEAQASAGAMLHLLLDKRFAPQVWHLKRLIDQGALGEIVSVTGNGPHPLLHRATRPDWFFRRGHYGGILLDLAIHDLDLVRWLSGSKITAIHGATGLRRFTDRPEFEDTGDAFVVTESGCTGHVHVDWLTPDAAPYWGDYRVYVTGTLGNAEAHWYPGNTLTVCTVEQPPHQVALAPVPDSFADFITALVNGTAPAVTTQDVLAASAAAVAAQESARSGRPAVPIFA